MNGRNYGRKYKIAFYLTYSFSKDFCVNYYKMGLLAPFHPLGVFRYRLLRLKAICSKSFDLDRDKIYVK